MPDDRSTVIANAEGVILRIIDASEDADVDALTEKLFEFLNESKRSNSAAFIALCQALASVTADLKDAAALDDAARNAIVAAPGIYIASLIGHMDAEARPEAQA